MKRNICFQRLLRLLLALLFCFCTARPAAAATFPEGWPSAPDIADESGILMETTTGQILYDKNMDDIRYPASTTKVMTALLILEHYADLNTVVTFTDIILPDLEPGNSTINAQVGEQLTVEQCLYAIMLASANEVCTQMAVEVAGSVENFTTLMNQKAAELGCTNTHFVNANGLPDPSHYTTAHDLALILAAAIQNEAFCRISGSALYTIPATNMTPSERHLENSSGLIKDGEFHYEGVLAGKTGHTEAARNTLVTAASREDMTFVCVVMRSENNDRFTDTIKLFDYGFDNFHKEPLYWTSKEEAERNVILPNGVSTNQLTVSDQDQEGTRTRTFSYRQTPLFTVSKPLPIATETLITSDISMFQTGMQEITIISPLILPIMSILLMILLVCFLVVVIKGAWKPLQDKKKRKKRLP